MKTKTITPPKFLYEIHGSSTTLFDIILTYSGGLIALISIYILTLQNDIVIPIWKLILLLITSADIGAGIVANFTKGTNSYYSGDTKKKARVIFILLHFLHCATFLYLLDLFTLKTIAIVIFIIISTLLINAMKAERQKVIASLFIVLGISSLLVLNITNPFLLWAFPLYMVKLFLGFGIRRY